MFSNFVSQAHNYNEAYPVKKNEIDSSNRCYHSNNKYDNVPPFMNDGRSLVATNQSDSVENKKLLEDNNITSNWQYRRYLTKNATQIMNDNYMSSTDNGFINKVIDVPSIQSNKITYEVLAPQKQHTLLDNATELVDPKEDLRVTYLTREQLQSRKVSPAITQEQLIKK